MLASIAAQHKVHWNVKKSATKCKSDHKKYIQQFKGKKTKVSTLGTKQLPASANQTSAVPKCDYGCMHGGLVVLIQMVTSNTKYCLEVGNFFYQ
jgi:hypothetical protein